jgi:hypothetical protein
MGCSSQGKAPSVPTSSGQAAYAMGYSEDLAAATKAISDAQTREKQLSVGFAAHVDELRKPDWAKVETIVEDSDEAGKSAAYADTQGGATAIKSFWESDKNELAGRVAGNMQPAMQKSGCNADVNASIGYAMQEAINKQLQKKLRSKNEAFVVIERYKTSLGPQNVGSLEKLADEISEASYDVHILMVVQRNRLDKLVSDKNDVVRTLDRYVKDETEFQQEPGRTEPEKKASQDRITAANKSKADIDKVAAQAETTSKEMEKSIDASTKDYEDALKALKAKVEEKKKAEPKAEGKPESKAATPAPAVKPDRAPGTAKPADPKPADAQQFNP